jgi:hypothetical protein
MKHLQHSSAPTRFRTQDIVHLGLVKKTVAVHRKRERAPDATSLLANSTSLQVQKSNANDEHDETQSPPFLRSRLCQSLNASAGRLGIVNARPDLEIPKLVVLARRVKPMAPKQILPNLVAGSLVAWI